jgi:chromosome segregation ATPase
MPALADQMTELQKAIEAKQTEIQTHETAVAEHRKSIEGASIEDLKNPQSELMQKADEVMKPLSQAKSDLADLEHAFRQVALMQPDGGKSLEGQGRPDRARRAHRAQGPVQLAVGRREGDRLRGVQAPQGDGRVRRRHPAGHRPGRSSPSPRTAPTPSRRSRPGRGRRRRS